MQKAIHRTEFQNLTIHFKIVLKKFRLFLKNLIIAFDFILMKTKRK
jgi:hypothetical protein